jgi:DNA-binding NarL/FixJ family response regulator
MSRPKRLYRVLVAHGSAIFLLGLTGVLSRRAELEVVGEAADAGELVDTACQLRPDVVVFDAGFLGGSDEVSGELLRRLPGVAILTLSSTGSLLEATRALYAGCSGYVLEDADPELLVAAIIVAAHGYAVAPHVLMVEIARASNPLAHPQQLLGGLSPREFEVLRDLADGMTTEALAGRFGISEKTVRNHIASMYAKLGLRDRSQLVRYAIEKGLGRPLKAQSAKESGSAVPR